MQGYNLNKAKNLYVNYVTQCLLEALLKKKKKTISTVSQ